MPQKSMIERARKDAREGKSPSTQAGEFVRKVIHAIREGKHGARSPKQAIAIGLSEARRAGVKLPKAPKGTASRKKEEQAKKSGKSTSGASAAHSARPHSTTRSRATTRALKREPHSSASHAALSKHAHQAAQKRSASSRKASAQKAARTRKHTRHAGHETYTS